MKQKTESKSRFRSQVRKYLVHERNTTSSLAQGEIVKSETLFQIDFENKRVVIDRMTAEFQVSMQGAEQPFGGGTCTRIEQRKF